MFADGEALWAAIPVRGGDMERINLPLFYQLGAHLNPLTQLDPNRATRSDVFIAGIQVKAYMTALFEAYPILHVCRAASEQLGKAIEVMGEWFRSASPEQLRETVQVTDFQFRAVINKAKEFEIVLSAELNVLATYLVTSKGAYSTAELIERADLILSESVRKKVPQEALEEIKQAGRCLALDSPTASGFHMMRALEAVLHQYYLAVCKPKSKKVLDSWAAYLAELKKVAGEEEEDEKSGAAKDNLEQGDPQVKRVITFLYQIKDTRNNIMHPELVLSADEAFGLLDVGKGAIIVMADRLPVREVEGD
jgi:hypothetical protein